MNSTSSKIYQVPRVTSSRQPLQQEAYVMEAGALTFAQHVVWDSSHAQRSLCVMVQATALGPTSSTWAARDAMREIVMWERGTGGHDRLL